jgi:hypothetical protein
LVPVTVFVENYMILILVVSLSNFDPAVKTILIRLFEADPSEESADASLISVLWRPHFNTLSFYRAKGLL